MKNKEKYFDEIIDIVPFARLAVSRNLHKPCKCNRIKCEDCLFGDHKYGCDTKLKEWFEEEYVPYVDWSKVKVDTKILVSDNQIFWRKRYFAKCEDGKVYAWENGKTSWSVESENLTQWWQYAKLYEGEGNEE